MALLWALRVDDLPLPALGFTATNAGRNALAGAVVILPVVLYFIFRFGLGDGVDYEEVEGQSWGGFLLWALVQEPLGTAFFEEALFRGVLLAKMARA